MHTAHAGGQLVLYLNHCFKWQEHSDEIQEKSENVSTVCNNVELLTYKAGTLAKDNLLIF